MDVGLFSIMYSLCTICGLMLDIVMKNLRGHLRCPSVRRIKTEITK